MNIQYNKIEKIDDAFLKKAKKILKKLILLAKKRRGLTYPNPVTAAAVVQGDDIISIGIHQKAGQPHAERLALKAAGDRAKGADLYINLEPCTIEGKTPPCVQAIIEAGIKKVVYCVDDPNPEVRKNSARSILTKAGIEVVSGILEEEASELNRIFFTNMKKNRPWVVVKAAASLDGKIALSTGESKYITGEIARKGVHHLRRECGAVLVGAGTVVYDDPLLTVRYGLEKGFPTPARVILDPKGRLPLSKQVFNSDTTVFWIQDPDQKSAQLKTPLPSHIRVLYSPHQNGQVVWEKLLTELYNHKIYALLVEGGQRVFTSIIQSKCVDQIEISLAPTFLGGGAHSLFSKEWEVRNLAEKIKLAHLTCRKSGPDIWISAKLA